MCIRDRIEEYNYGYTNRYNHRFIPRNSASGYIHFKDLKGGNTRIPDAPTPTNNTGSSIASSGSYQFTERVSIKACLLYTSSSCWPRNCCSFY